MGRAGPETCEEFSEVPGGHKPFRTFCRHYSSGSNAHQWPRELNGVRHSSLLVNFTRSSPMASYISVEPHQFLTTGLIHFSGAALFPHN
ncbi:hypothetical protein NDU88_001213 [Pleurodeles waltl]|uniref:Uncharacterized protein n=1 Tax=Pleurodeles waltl TaxID=8319 RepID=A0AAV7PAH9_PLEWA|nr:hypothetical protein NDU88_001213 [Pleurodeles waltl]